MPHFGQTPGAGRSISGCMLQVKRSPAAAGGAGCGVSGFEAAGGCQGAAA